MKGLWKEKGRESGTGQDNEKMLGWRIELEGR